LGVALYPLYLSLLSLSPLLSLACFSLILPPPLRSTLFPYTTLFRSTALKPSRDCGANFARNSRLRRVPLVKLSISGSRSLRCFRSEEHTSELQSPDHLVCRLLLEKKNRNPVTQHNSAIRTTNQPPST